MEHHNLNESSMGAVLRMHENLRQLIIAMVNAVDLERLKDSSLSDEEYEDIVRIYEHRHLP